MLANAPGEAVGLGTASLIGATLAWIVETALGAFAGVAMMAALVFAGTFEGTVVGVAQALVLRRWLHSLSWKKWVLATAAGALVAWILGMLPTALMDLSAEATGAPAPEISDAMQYAFAILLGAVAGPILGFAQWIVLRRHVPKAVRGRGRRPDDSQTGLPQTLGRRSGSSGNLFPSGNRTLTWDDKDRQRYISSGGRRW